MQLREYAQILARHWLTVVLITLLTLAATASVTLLLTPKYTATTRLFFAVQAGDSASDLTQGSTFAEKQMTSYVEVATSPLVLQPVIDQLGLTQTPAVLALQLSATVPADTVIIDLSATDADPESAARIANAVGAQLSKVAATLSPKRSNGTEPVRATVLAPAQTPLSASSPNVPVNMLGALALGLLLGVATALVRNSLETSVRGEADVAGVTKTSILGVIPYDGTAPGHPVVMHDDPLGARSESVRRLRTNLQFVGLTSESNSMVVTSSIPGEGKSTTAINLAVSIADAGSKVLLLDADLRRPSIADYLGIEGSVGLTTVLVGNADFRDVVQPWRGTTLDILPSGLVPPNPSELLGSKAMASLLERVSAEYDVVLLDTSPLLPVTDAVILSGLCGGTIVVVGADRVHRAQLSHAMQSLGVVGINVLGIVLNKVAKRDPATYGDYNTYSSAVAQNDVVPVPAR